MVDPADLLGLARRLLTEHSEIADRSAVSRAYYAAFWHCRTVAEERFGPIDTPGSDIHRELANQVELFNPDAARDLVELRRARNTADYAPRRSFQREFAAEHVGQAARLLRLT